MSVCVYVHVCMLVRWCMCVCLSVWMGENVKEKPCCCQYNWNSKVKNPKELFYTHTHTNSHHCNKFRNVAAWVGSSGGQWHQLLSRVHFISAASCFHTSFLQCVQRAENTFKTPSFCTFEQVVVIEMSHCRDLHLSAERTGARSRKRVYQTEKEPKLRVVKLWTVQFRGFFY